MVSDNDGERRALIGYVQQHTTNYLARDDYIAGAQFASTMQYHRSWGAIGNFVLGRTVNIVGVGKNHGIANYSDPWGYRVR